MEFVRISRQTNLCKRKPQTFHAFEQSFKACNSTFSIALSLTGLRRHSGIQHDFLTNHVVTKAATYGCVSCTTVRTPFVRNGMFLHVRSFNHTFFENGSEPLTVRTLCIGLVSSIRKRSQSSHLGRINRSRNGAGVIVFAC